LTLSRQAELCEHRKGLITVPLQVARSGF